MTPKLHIFSTVPEYQTMATSYQTKDVAIYIQGMEVPQGNFITHIYCTRYQDQFFQLPIREATQEATADFMSICVPMQNYIEDWRQAPDLPLALLAPSPLQKATYLALATVACGQRISYGELAHMAGYPKAVRAVASVVARNPLAFLLPCHRIVRANGDVGQYAYGAEFKDVLLMSESI